MKRRTLYILIAILLLILFIAYSFSNFSFRNIIPQASLPEKYKGYREIQSGVISQNYQSVLLFNSDNVARLEDFPPLFNADNNTVIVARRKDSPKGDQSDPIEIFLKFNTNGTVIDSLIFKEDWPINWAGFLITPTNFCSWMLDGDKRNRPYAEQNQALTEDSLALAQHFKQLYKAAQWVYYYHYFDLYNSRLDSLHIDKALFYQQGHWIALLGKNLSDFETDGYPAKGESLVNGMHNRAPDEHIDRRNAYIYMDYFQKVHFTKGRGPTPGSPTGLSSQDEWQGSGYLNLILKKDTLHITQDMTKDEGWSGESSPYRPPLPIYYFTNDRLNFGLFTNNGYQLFIIKKKVK